MQPAALAIDLPGRLAQSWSMTRESESSDPADADLVQAAQRGDHEAFRLLHDRYARVVHGVLLARVPAGEVSDLLQDVFVRAWERVADLRDAGAFGAWLVQIARRCAADFYRGRRDTLPIEEHEPADPSSGHDLEAVHVLALLRSLPDAYRETLTLRLVEGLTGPEIAAQTGLTPGSVRVNLHRGMKLLKSRLGWRS